MASKASRDKSHMPKTTAARRLMIRYGLIGGGIGLYFGLFFRPVRQPSLAFVLMLAVLIAVVMTLIRAFREKPSLSELLTGAVATFVKASLALLLLEMRHVVYQQGGKALVTVFTTIMGGAAGLWYAVERLRRRTSSGKAEKKAQ